MMLNTPIGVRWPGTPVETALRDPRAVAEQRHLLAVDGNHDLQRALRHVASRFLLRIALVAIGRRGAARREGA